MKLDADLDMKFSDPSVDNLSHCDVVFFASPNGVAMDMARDLVKNDIRLIDISADFRLPDAEIWEKWYGKKHTSPELIEQSVYGLPEMKNQNPIHP